MIPGNAVVKAPAINTDHPKAAPVIPAMTTMAIPHRILPAIMAGIRDI